MKKTGTYIVIFICALLPTFLHAQYKAFVKAQSGNSYIFPGSSDGPSSTDSSAGNLSKITAYYWSPNSDTAGGNPAFTLHAKVEYCGAYLLGQSGGNLILKEVLRSHRLYILPARSVYSKITGFDARFFTPSGSDSAKEYIMHSKNDMLTNDMLNYMRRHRINTVVFCNIRCSARDGSTITVPNISFTIYEKESLINQ